MESGINVAQITETCPDKSLAGGAALDELEGD